MRSEIRLLAIASPPFLSKESVLAKCRAAENGGVTAVQLRLKTEPSSALLAIAKELVATLSIPVYVNDRADIALAAGASGVHVGADDSPPAAVRKIAPRAFRIGVSVGNELEATAARTADVDYWSIGSVYATGSKPDAGQPIGPSGFKRLAAIAPADMPIMAIGGVNQGNVTEIISSGAQGIAVISAIFGAPDVEMAARGLRTLVDQALHT